MGILRPLYPNPSNHDHSSERLSSNVPIDFDFCKVNAISSSPLRRQCRRNGSTVNLIGVFPFALRTSSFSRSTSSSNPASASSANTPQSSCDSTMGSMPFCIELLRKISAILGAIMHRMPKSFLWQRYSNKSRSVGVIALTSSKARAPESYRTQSSCRCRPGFWPGYMVLGLKQNQYRDRFADLSLTRRTEHSPDPYALES